MAPAVSFPAAATTQRPDPSCGKLIRTGSRAAAVVVLVLVLCAVLGDLGLWAEPGGGVAAVVPHPPTTPTATTAATRLYKRNVMPSLRST
ncbi:hypothetical protein Abr02nite_56180 [Paractinoplanes brasiliensis]|nr:hypothetical protein Abr02nite_56180 [Actinoplanes brasiliensis]